MRGVLPTSMQSRGPVLSQGFARKPRERFERDSLDLLVAKRSQDDEHSLPHKPLVENDPWFFGNVVRQGALWLRSLPH